MKKLTIILFLIFISFTTFSQYEDCNYNRDCVLEVLTSKSNGWLLESSTGLAFEGNPCPETNNAYFYFRVNGEFEVYSTTYDCNNDIILNNKMYSTSYKLVSLNSNDKQGVRIYHFSPNIKKALDSGYNFNLKDSVDFEFLFNSKKYSLLLIENNVIQKKSFKNIFK
jgi:hypothetical protein